MKETPPTKIYKNDYIILNSGEKGKIIKVYNEPKFQVYVPGNNITDIKKIDVNFSDIKFKLVNWAFDLKGAPIAPVSKFATFVKEGQEVDGWVMKTFDGPKNYKKIFKVRCSECMKSY